MNLCIHSIEVEDISAAKNGTGFYIHMQKIMMKITSFGDDTAHKNLKCYKYHITDRELFVDQRYNYLIMLDGVILQSSFVGAIAIGDLIKSTLGPKGMVCIYYK